VFWSNVGNAGLVHDATLKELLTACVLQHVEPAHKATSA
jgi:hypothetical protein